MPNMISVDADLLGTLKATAYSLLQKGNTAESEEIFNVLEKIIDHDIITSISMARIALSKSDGLSSLKYLKIAKSLLSDYTIITPLIHQAVMDVGLFVNKCLQEEKIETAYNAVMSMIDIMPRHIDFLQSAIRLAKRLDRLDEAADLSRQTIAIDANNIVANQSLAEFYARQGDMPQSLRHEAAYLMERGKSETLDKTNMYDLIYPQDMYDLYSKIIKTWPTAESLEIAGRVKRRALAYSSVKTGFDLVDVANDYFTIALRTNDESRIAAPTPDYAPWPQVDLADSSGTLLSLAQWTMQARLSGAEQILFVAGDPKYVRTYAPTYIRSALQRAGINCLIIILVADGRGHLPQIIADIGIQDKRVLYMADHMNCQTKKRYMLKEQHDNGNVSYYQCARFIWSGFLLNMINMPLVISDIDVVLQKTLSDMLDKYRDYDVVLNENGSNIKLASIFTANLLIINPTDASEKFCRFLRSYIEMMLHHTDIDGFLDQSSLAMARAHVMMHYNGKFGYFERYDINNTMYNRAISNIENLKEDINKYTFFAFYGSLGDTAETLLDIFGEN